MTDLTAYPEQDQYGRPRTPYAIWCPEGPLDGYPGCGLVYLTQVEYYNQLGRPDSVWVCPICHMRPVRWDDENYSQMLDREQEEKS